MYLFHKEFPAQPRSYPLKKIRSERKTVEIRINAAAEVTVYAPKTMSDKAVDRFIDQNNDKIEKAIRKMRAKTEYPAAPCDNMMRVKGKALPVIAKLGIKNDVSFAEEYIFVTVTKKSIDAVKKTLWNGFTKTARADFTARFYNVGQEARSLGLITEHDFIVKDLKSKWGSCDIHGKIMLNVKLFGADPAQIDYVIAHEYCHLKEMNHGAGFYDLLARLYPGYKEKRAGLKAAAPLLMRPLELTEEIFIP